MNTPGQNTPTTPIKPEKSPEQIKSQLLDMLERASPEKVVRILDTYRQLKVEHATLEYIAKHDLLTQLPNRKALDLYIKESITSIDSEAVFMIFDLRKFKDINDRYGHEMGDEVLKFIALVCREVCAIYPNSVIARK